MGKVIMSGIVEPLTKPIALPPVGTALEDMTWEDVKLISDMGLAADYFSVGDTKSVKVNGTVGTLSVNATYKVFILGIDHNESIEGKGIHFGCFKTSGGVDVCLVDSRYGGSYNASNQFIMNGPRTNSGGWASCHMRKNILGSDSTPTSPTVNTMLAALPVELRAVMKAVSKYTDNKGGGTNTASNVTATTDYLPLLAEFELGGTRASANSYEQNHQKQYDYYKSGNSKIKYKHNATTTAAYWWTRSPTASGSGNFAYMVYTGQMNNHTTEYSYGVAPLFCV